MAQRSWLQGVADQLSVLRSHAVPEPEEPSAWHTIAQELLAHANQPDSLPEQRPLYEEFLSKFPTAALHWKAYAELAMAMNSPEVRNTFSRSLLNCPSVELWSTYLTFIKRVNQSKGEAGMLETRKAYEYALDRIGLDLHAAGLWHEYINYLQLPRPNTPAYRALWTSTAGPGQEDSQRVMTLRGAYQRAMQVPCTGLDQLWRAYEVFEQQGSSRALARRVLEQQRPRYQAARTALGPRSRLQAALNPTALPFPPGAAGYEQQQLAVAWRAYLAWECSNPQKLSGPELAARVSLAYDQALMPLRLYPDVWLEQADWRMQGEGGSPQLALQILKKARQVLPGCLLLHFAAADLQEGQGDIDAARHVYQDLLPSLNPEEPPTMPPPQMTPGMTTCTWVQCLSFVRRAQSLKDARQTFLKASKVPDIGWQVFVASALMEWHHDNSNVKVPKNIWELGAKRFMAEPAFVLAYIDFQLGLGDTANCRATFERALTVTPPPQAKPLWDQYLRFEAQHGSPEAVSKVEQRRREALAPVSPLDQLHSLLLKHQEGDLWPLQPVEQEHFKRLLGLAPPLPQPVTPGPPPQTHQHGAGPGPGPGQGQGSGPANGRPSNPGASPMMDNWSPAAAQHASPMHGPASGPGQGPLPAAPGPHPHGPAPGMHANGPGPGPAQNGPGPGPLLQPPPAAPRGPPQPLTQFPVELGNFINKLPPARTLEGAHPNVDQVIDILMTADLFAGDPRMEGNDMAGPAGAGPNRWHQGGADPSFPGQPMHQQAGQGRQPDQFEPNGQQAMQDNMGQKRKQPDSGFGGPSDAQEPNGFAASPTIRNAPPAHDVFRMRRKQRTKMAEG